MNKALEEFKELRLAYSGRIDAAIKDKNDEALEQAKADYKKILEKYMNIACQVLSAHTNHPFSVTKKTHRGTVLRSEKSVLKDTNSIRESLNFIKLPDAILSDIKTSLDVVEDYYNKILSEIKANKTDETKFSFRIIFGSIIAPFFAIIMSLIYVALIHKFFPNNLNNSSQIAKLIEQNPDSVSLSMTLSFSGVLIVLIGLFIWLFRIYINKTRDCVLNKKQIMLVPVSIINLLIILGPLNLVIDYLFGPLMSVEVVNAIKDSISGNLALISVVLFIVGLISSNYDSGDYKATIGIGHIVMIILIFLTVVFPVLLAFIIPFIDLSAISGTIIVLVLILAILDKFMVFVYLIYLIVVINRYVFHSENCELIYKIISIVVSAVVTLLVIISSVSNIKSIPKGNLTDIQNSVNN